MIYKFMAEHESEFRIQRMCRVLGIGRSGYYAWRSRPASQRVQVDDALLVKIKQEYQSSRGTYGSPRIHAALHQQGVKCGRKRVARLMRLHKITGRKRQKRRPVTTQRDPGAMPAPNLLNQEFCASIPNQKWVSDITYIETAEGWLYLASVLDLYSRKVVGWAMADHMEARRCSEDGFTATSARSGSTPPLGSRPPIYQCRLPKPFSERSLSGQYEPGWKLL